MSEEKRRTRYFVAVSRGYSATSATSASDAINELMDWAGELILEDGQAEVNVYEAIDAEDIADAAQALRLPYNALFDLLVKDKRLIDEEYEHDADFAEVIIYPTSKINTTTVYPQEFSQGVTYR